MPGKLQWMSVAFAGAVYAPAEDPDFPIDEVRSALGGYAAAFCWWERFQAQGNSSSMRLAG